MASPIPAFAANSDREKCFNLLTDAKTQIPACTRYLATNPDSMDHAIALEMRARARTAITDDPQSDRLSLDDYTLALRVLERHRDRVERDERRGKIMLLRSRMYRRLGDAEAADRDYAEGLALLRK